MDPEEHPVSTRILYGNFRHQIILTELIQRNIFYIFPSDRTCLQPVCHIPEDGISDHFRVFLFLCPF